MDSFQLDSLFPAETMNITDGKVLAKYLEFHFCWAEQKTPGAIFPTEGMSIAEAEVQVKVGSYIFVRQKKST